jgi:phosphatidylglycerol:prolipoprotein diacylglycerol transferase
MAGSHIYNIVVDQFSVFMSDPSIFFQLNGISSAGALNGGLWCGLLWCRYRGLSWLDICRRVDIATYAMPLAFMLGRLGCAFAHDHLGIPSNSWLAVNFPRGPRFDLGLIEFLFLAGVVILFHILDRRRRPLGFFFGLFGVLYGAFRLGLNTIRTEQEYVYGVAAIVIGAAGWFIMPALEKSQSATFPLPDDANRIAELLG